MSVNAANGVDYPRSPSSVQSFAVTAGTSSSSTSVVEPQHLLHLQQHQQPVTSSHFIRSSEVALAVAVPPDGVHQQAALSSTGEASGKVKNKKRVPKYRATKRPPSDRRFQCDHCDSRFFTQKDVKRHLVVHTGVRNYACQFCTQRFGRKDHLVRHAKKSHDQDTRSLKRRSRDSNNQQQLQPQLLGDQLLSSGAGSGGPKKAGRRSRSKRKANEGGTATTDGGTFPANGGSSGPSATTSSSTSPSTSYYLPEGHNTDFNGVARLHAATSNPGAAVNVYSSSPLLSTSTLTASFAHSRNYPSSLNPHHHHPHLHHPHHHQQLYEPPPPLVSNFQYNGSAAAAAATFNQFLGPPPENGSSAYALPPLPSNATYISSYEQPYKPHPGGSLLTYSGNGGGSVHSHSHPSHHHHEGFTSLSSPLHSGGVHLPPGVPPSFSPGAFKTLANLDGLSMAAVEQLAGDYTTNQAAVATFNAATAAAASAASAVVSLSPSSIFTSCESATGTGHTSRFQLPFN